MFDEFFHYIRHNLKLNHTKSKPYSYYQQLIVLYYLLECLYKYFPLL